MGAGSGVVVLVASESTDVAGVVAVVVVVVVFVVVVGFGESCIVVAETAASGALFSSSSAVIILRHLASGRTALLSGLVDIRFLFWLVNPGGRPLFFGAAKNILSWFRRERMI